MVINSDITTIRVSRVTLSRLKEFGRFGDSMEDILVRLIDDSD